jgi:hypothetical protein
VEGESGSASSRREEKTVTSVKKWKQQVNVEGSRRHQKTAEESGKSECERESGRECTVISTCPSEHEARLRS